MYRPHTYDPGVKGLRLTNIDREKRPGKAGPNGMEVVTDDGA